MGKKVVPIRRRSICLCAVFFGLADEYLKRKIMNPLLFPFLLPVVIISVFDLRTDAADPHKWNGTARSLLCNASGTKKEKALEIKQNLESYYPDDLWYILVMDEDQRLSYRYNDGHLETYPNACDKLDMLIWNSEASKTECDSKRRDQVNLVVTNNDDKGKTSEAIRKSMTLSMNTYEYDFHFIVVNDGKSSYDHNLVRSCFVTHAHNKEIG